MGRFDSFTQGRPNGGSRRVSPIAVRLGKGRLTEPTAAVHAWRPELVFMPHSRPSTSAIAGSSGGVVNTFAASCRIA